jgi:signal transduction histidine kinase
MAVKYTILIIDDNADMRTLTQAVLEREGYRILLAENGMQGLKLAVERQPDLIICDLMMPDIDGHEVLRRLRQHPEQAEIPFILLTAHGDKIIHRKTMALGADDFLTKPVPRVVLVDAVKSQLNKHARYLEARQAEKEAKRRLSLMVAHELRTPLVGLSMAQEILLRRLGQLSEDQQRELLEGMDGGIRRLRHLVEQMVLLTQLENQNISMEKIHSEGAHIPMWSLLVPAVNLAKQFNVRAHHVQVRVEERDRQAIVLCDQGSLKHALAELICNALAFSPQDSEVTVAEWFDETQVWISIVDYGKGMRLEDIPIALKPFEQIDRETQEQQGVGLGLPLAKRIIEAHGGALEIHSVLGKGTEVLVCLPATKIHNEEADA